MACVASEDSGQPGHLPRLISRCWLNEESLGPELPIERTAKTLIRLGGWSSFCWALKHFVGFVMRRLIWDVSLILKRILKSAGKSGMQRMVTGRFFKKS